MNIKREIEAKVTEALKYFRVIYIDGARQIGKTTFVKTYKKTGFNYVTFDDENILNLAQSNPKLFFSTNPTPLIIDEVQKAPHIIDAIKMRVDENDKPGQFILTGSVDMFKSKKIKESLAGRHVKYEMYPFSYTEVNNYNFNLIDILFEEKYAKALLNLPQRDENFIISKLMSGYFPEIQNKPPNIIEEWFESYIESRITKDILDLTENNLRKADKIPQLLELLSKNTSNLMNQDNLAQTLGISPHTVKEYVKLLENLFFIKKINSYHKNKGKQVKKMQKVYFIDTGLVSYLSGISDNELLINRQLFGQLLENYIYIELQKHISTSEQKFKIYYYRDVKKNEVDFIIENKSGKTIAIEVKSAERIEKNDIKGLESFHKNYKNNILAMYVIYGGQNISAITVNNTPVTLLPYRFFF